VGMSITSLQAYLGHESIVTTRDHYAPTTPLDELIDEVASYGRLPRFVVNEAKKAQGMIFAGE